MTCRFFYFSRPTFSGFAKCFICKENFPWVGVQYCSKSLIPLKKITVGLLRTDKILIQCKKVQLSGEKCHSITSPPLPFTLSFCKGSPLCFRVLHR